MRTHGAILKSLNEAKKETPLVPPNADNSKPTGRKEGDTIKIIDSHFDKMDSGTIWRCAHVQGTPYGDDSTNKGIWSMNIYVKINSVTGKETTSNVSKLNMSGSIWLSNEDLDKVFTKGKVEVLQPHLPYNQGEVTAEDIQAILTNIGADFLTGVKVAKMIDTRPRSSHIDIEFKNMGTDDRVKAQVYKKLITVLDARGYSYRLYVGYGAVTELPTGVTSPSYISITKR